MLGEGLAHITRRDVIIYDNAHREAAHVHTSLYLAYGRPSSQTLLSAYEDWMRGVEVIRWVKHLMGSLMNYSLTDKWNSHVFSIPFYYNKEQL